MQEYSVGFLHNDTDVALVRKNRPEWQAGFLNGIGGKIEEGEDAHDAQIREFQEEAGRFVGPWDHFLTLEGTRARVYCFAVYDENDEHIYKLQTIEDEEIEVWVMDDLNGPLDLDASQTVPNLEWIIPLMRQRAKYAKPIIIEFHGDA